MILVAASPREPKGLSRTRRHRRPSRGAPPTAQQKSRARRVALFRRIGAHVIAENQGKARHAGELRVALFPSKHSRVRIPSPALIAEHKYCRPPTRRPTSKANPFFGGSEHTLWPYRFPRFACLMMTSCSRVGPCDAPRQHSTTIDTLRAASLSGWRGRTSPDPQRLPPRAFQSGWR